jgi:hypothetical protein
MVALAQPERFEEATPLLQVVNVPSDAASGPLAEVRFFTTAEPYIWRVRSCAVHGRVTGTMGTARVGLSFDIGLAAGEPWTNSANDSGVQAMSPQDLNPGDNFAYTWSTEIGDNYLSDNNQWGKTAVLGLPMVYLPAHTDIVIEMSSFGGFDGDLITRDGYMMIEYLAQGAAGAGGSANADLYLLPALG